MQKLPEADIVIIRRSGTKWTKDQLQRLLPDGIRHTQSSFFLLNVNYLKEFHSITVI